MKTRFAKGNWSEVVTDSNERAVRNEGGLICRMVKPSRYADQMERYINELDEVRANAKLIAAAPEMISLIAELRYAIIEEINPSNNLLKKLGEIDRLIKKATE